MNKRLTDLASKLVGHETFGKTDLRISGIVDDSRKVKKGDLFVAIKGDTVDAHKFINDVIKRGAIAIIGEVKPKKKWLEEITYIKVDNSRKSLGLIVSAWHGNPSSKLKVIGVTGTDGKTTTATIIYHILKSAGKKVGLITTVSAKIGDKEFDTGFHVTNPEPLELQKFLSKMVKEGCEYAVLEVTSHGLVQDRVAGVDFDTAVLTNITREHIDYHKTQKDYFNAKVKLFMFAKSAVVLNKDDKSFDKLLTIVAKKSSAICYGIENGEVDLRAVNIQRSAAGTEFNAIFKGQAFKVSTSLLGKYNVSNVLAAIAAANVYEISNKNITTALKLFKGIEGRFEEVENDKGIRIVIDFAHTPNSLESILKVLKNQTKGKLIVVFGCAGERDVEKRVLMPKISVKYADISVFTSEDPRDEDINKILRVMKDSVKNTNARELKIWKSKKSFDGITRKLYLSIPERGEAISLAINKLAKKGDTVAILGKGHEKSMCYNEVEYPWSDHDAVKLALNGEMKEIIRK